MSSPVALAGLYWRLPGLYDRWMATPRLERLSGALVGRELECAAIDQLLEASARGESSSLVLRGEAGIGKSALLDHLTDHAVGGRRLCRVGEWPLIFAEVGRERGYHGNAALLAGLREGPWAAPRSDRHFLLTGSSSCRLTMCRGPRRTPVTSSAC